MMQLGVRAQHDFEAGIAGIRRVRSFQRGEGRALFQHQQQRAHGPCPSIQAQRLLDDRLALRAHAGRCRPRAFASDTALTAFVFSLP